MIAPNAFPSRQKGVALMLVILVFALVSILAVGINKRQKLFMHGSGSVLVNSQAYQYALGSEAYARRLLLEDWRQDKDKNEFVDDLEQVESAIVLPVDNATLEAQFNDLHGRLNLNDLVFVDGSPNDLMVQRVKRLIERLALDSVKVERIQDWIDENQEATGIEGYEDGEYLSLEVPYRTGGQPFKHSSELLLIDGITPDVYAELLPYISILPQGRAPINLNTASAEVLQAIVPDLEDAQAESLVNTAKESPWKSVNDFFDESAVQGIKVDKTYLGVSSNFYEVATRITLSERKVRLKTILYRAPEDGSVTLIQRDQGQKYLITKQSI